MVLSYVIELLKRIGQNHRDRMLGILARVLANDARLDENLSEQVDIDETTVDHVHMVYAALVAFLFFRCCSALVSYLKSATQIIV